MGCNGLSQNLKNSNVFLINLTYFSPVLYSILFACSSGRCNVISVSYRYRICFASALLWEIRSRRFQIALDTLAVRMVCWVKIFSLTGSSQQPVVDKQTKMLSGSLNNTPFWPGQKNSRGDPGSNLVCESVSKAI